MKFFLDANMPYSSSEIFRRFGYDVLHAGDVRLSNAVDEKILKYSIENNRILVTKDLDFGNILNYPLKSHKGIIILRLPFFFTAKQINNVLSDFLKSIKENEIKDAITILEIGRYRIRK